MGKFRDLFLKDEVFLFEFVFFFLMLFRQVFQVFDFCFISFKLLYGKCILTDLDYAGPAHFRSYMPCLYTHLGRNP